MHQPVTLSIVAPVAILFTFALPLLSWILHLIVDYLQIQYLDIASIPEMILTGAMATLLIWDDIDLCRLSSDEPVGLRAFLSWELDQAKAEAKLWLPSWSRRAPTTGA